MIEQKKLKIVIPDAAFQKVMYWVNKSNFEVSGFADLVFDPKNHTLTVGDPFLCQQENHSTETEMTAESIGKAMYKLAMENRELRWWWHSHVNMQVFWSGTDMDAMRKLGGNGWVAATVFNKKCETRSALLTNTMQMGEKMEVFIDNISTHIQDRLLDPETVALCDREYSEMVTIKDYRGTIYYGPHHKGGVVDFSSDYSRTWDRPGEKKPHGNKGKKKKKHSSSTEARTEKLWTEEEIGRICDSYKISRFTFNEIVKEYGANADRVIDSLYGKDSYGEGWAWADDEDEVEEIDPNQAILSELDWGGGV